MKKLLILIIFALASCNYATAQTVTISQETADKSANCLREQQAKDDLITTLNAARATDSQLIENLKAQNNILIEIQRNDAAEKVELRKAIIELVGLASKRKKCFISLLGC